VITGTDILFQNSRLYQLKLPILLFKNSHANSLAFLVAYGFLSINALTCCTKKTMKKIDLPGVQTASLSLYFPDKLIL
jgi:hypothetical protein